VYYRWSVHRRLFSAGKDDEIRGEQVIPFVIETPEGPMSLEFDEYTLHLSPRCCEAWTAWWDGLPEALQETVKERLDSEPLEGAQYHCSQAILAPGSPITLIQSPPLLTDLSLEGARRWVKSILVARLRGSVVLAALAGALYLFAS
jgi:hypothetical protein